MLKQRATPDKVAEQKDVLGRRGTWERARHSFFKMIPVVMLASSREEKNVVDASRFGVNSYIVKPVDFERFVQTILDLGMYRRLLNQPRE